MTMRSDLLSAERFLRQLTEDCPVENRRFLCAVSGGLDSMCLLVFTADWCAKNGGTVIAAHFNHRIRTAADRDERFVEQYCAQRNIPFLRGEKNCPALAKEQGWTLEEAARNARYGFLFRAAKKSRCRWILTAHHADDNAETMLLHLIRGTGSRGLCGIPAVWGNLARPFLEVSRQTLEQYAAVHKIPHVEDETNASDDMTRNRLRHQVLPLLRELNPRAVEHMTQTAQILRREDAALSAWAETLTQAAKRLPDGGVQIGCDVLRKAPRAVAERAVLALTGQIGGQRDVSAQHIAEILALLDRDGTARTLNLPHRVRVERQCETLTFTRSPAPLPELSLDPEQPVVFGRTWRVTWSRTAGAWPLRLPTDAALTVTAWKPSDRLTLPSGRGARSLKRLCAERGISPQQRDELPVLRINGTAAAVPGVGMDRQFLTENSRADGFVTFETIRDRDGGTST